MTRCIRFDDYELPAPESDPDPNSFPRLTLTGDFTRKIIIACSQLAMGSTRIRIIGFRCCQMLFKSAAPEIGGVESIRPHLCFLESDPNAGRKVETQSRYLSMVDYRLTLG